MEQQEYLEQYWCDIPIGKDNAIGYDDLCRLWGVKPRVARQILHALSRFDNKDNFVLIRSGSCKGFYKTDEIDRIIKYKQECLNKGRSNFAPVKKINRILSANDTQYSFYNNLRVTRESVGMNPREVVRKLRNAGIWEVDEPILNKLENGVVLPNPQTLQALATIYGVSVRDILDAEMYEVAT